MNPGVGRPPTPWESFWTSGEGRGEREGGREGTHVGRVSLQTQTYLAFEEASTKRGVCHRSVSRGGRSNPFEEASPKRAVYRRGGRRKPSRKEGSVKT